MGGIQQLDTKGVKEALWHIGHKNSAYYLYCAVERYGRKEEVRLASGSHTMLELIMEEHNARIDRKKRA